MTITIDYPIILSLLYGFVLGFATGAAVFGFLFYRERKRLVHTIRVSSEITARIGSICDDLVKRMQLILEERVDELETKKYYIKR